MTARFGKETMISSRSAIGRKLNEGAIYKGVGRELHPPKSLSFLPLIAWSPLGEPKWNPGGKGILEKKVAHTEQGEKDGE